MSAHYKKETPIPFLSSFNLKFMWYKLKKRTFCCYWGEALLILLTIFFIFISDQYSHQYPVMIESVLIPIASTVIISIIFYVFVNKRSDRQKLQVLKKTFSDIIYGHAEVLCLLLVKANLFNDNKIGFNSLESTKAIFGSIVNHPQDETFIRPFVHCMNDRNKNINKALDLVYVIPSEITQCLWKLSESEFSFWILTFLGDKSWSEPFLSEAFSAHAERLYNDHILLCKITEFYLQSFKTSNVEDDFIKIVLYGNVA